MAEDGFRFEKRLTRSIEERISLLGEDGGAYAALRDLPSYYRLFWHVAFDLTIAPSSRHFAGSLAFYIFSRIDYISEDTDAAGAYLDDLAVSVLGLKALLGDADGDRIRGYWASDRGLDQALAQAEALIEGKLPARVAARVATWLAR